MNEFGKKYHFEIIFDEDKAIQYDESVDVWYKQVATIVEPWGVKEVGRGVWTPMHGVRSDDLFTQIHAMTALAESVWFMDRVKSVTFFEENGEPNDMLAEIRRYRPHLISNK
ncbi:hypothetical protein AB1I62_03910 [Enterococcus sp. AN402]|uniref:hypothetical protein n=1 Tax=Enterococcus sp. AN402 TaxID=3151386 RepID=UPI00345A6956